mgnify:FL=1
MYEPLGSVTFYHLIESLTMLSFVVSYLQNVRFYFAYGLKDLSLIRDWNS